MTPRCAHGKYPTEQCLECDKAISDSFMSLVKRSHGSGAQQLDRGMVEEVLDVLRATSPNVEIITGLLEIINSDWIRQGETLMRTHGHTLDPATAARYGRIVARAKEAINGPAIDTGALPVSAGDPPAAD